MAGKTVTPYGREAVLDSSPQETEATVLAFQRRVTEAKRVLEKGIVPPFESHPEVNEAWVRAEKGGVLSAEELFHTGAFLRSTRLFAAFLENNKTILSSYASLAVRLHPQAGLEKKIAQSFTPSYEISDAASRALLEIRQALRKGEARLLDRLQEMIHSPSVAPCLQEPLITRRSGRYVLPVKETHRGRFKGILHDRSASGATLFMEPLAVVEWNNRLIEMKLREKEEEEAVLLALSREVGKAAHYLHASRGALALADAAFAAARWSLEIGGIPPEIRNSPCVVLAEARHPLLGKKAVPIDVEIGKDFRTLIITGPNTGGKTVSLKTVGLFAILAQCGFHLPARSASVGIFKQVLADIGDEQSIQQNLSTFSSHLSRILSFVPKAGARTLLLLDEIGAGTDPREGAALAMAILDYFHGRHTLTVATTHYAELKIFAEETAGMANASMLFHEETLEPAYRLRIGLPGRSLALLIAEKMGLAREILEAARGNLDKKSLQVESLLSALEKKERELSLSREAMDRVAAALKLERERFEEEKRIERTKLQSERERVLEQLRNLQGFVREKKEALKHAPAAEINELDKNLALQIEEAEAGLSGLEQNPGQRNAGLDPASARPGDPVWIASLGLAGTLVSLGKRKGLVQVGGLKVERPIEDLMAVEESIEAAIPEALVKADPATEGEIHLRGMRAEDALLELEKYLDRVALSPLSMVRVVHGKGGGILRRMIRDYLKTHPLVVDFRPGAPGEGGDGVTVVRMKNR